MTTTTKYTATKRAEVLERAISLLETKGWTRGQYKRVDSHGESFCTVGALQEVITYDDVLDSVGRLGNQKYVLQLAVQQDIADMYQLPHAYAVTTWNDRHRVPANLVGKLKKVARHLREHGA